MAHDGDARDARMGAVDMQLVDTGSPDLAAPAPPDLAAPAPADLAAPEQPDLAAPEPPPDLAPPDLTTDDAAVAAPPAIPLFDQTIHAVVHAGGSYYVGGRFTRISTYRAPNIIALDSSGTPTPCPLGTGFDGSVEAIVQSDSAIYVGGLFQHYQGASANHLAKIDATTCMLDTSFSPPANNGFDSFVNALAVSGSSLYVGGAFRAYRGVPFSANGLAKLDLTTGALDDTFTPAGASSNGFSGGTGTPQVTALAVSGTSLYVGGTFTDYCGVAGSANRIAKLDLVSALLDTTFSPPANNGFSSTVKALAVAGGSLYVGGFFASYRGVLYSANGLAKLDLASGDIDTTFSPVGSAANGVSQPSVYALAASTTSLYVGGDFTFYQNGGKRSALNLAKVDLATGALDTTFSPSASNGFDARVWALAVDGGYVYAAGQFTRYRGVPHSAEQLARLEATSGALDTTFLPAGSTANGFAGNGSPRTLIVAGSTIWVGGDLQIYGGHRVERLAKLDDTTFAIDTTFSPPSAGGFNGSVEALAATDSSLYVGGTFSSYRGVASSANRIAKLDLVSGAIDTTFSPPGATGNGFDVSYPASASVRALAVAGASLYVGGTFTAYRGVTSSANGLAKLDLLSGALDTTFAPRGATSNGFETNSHVDALAVSATSLYAGGSFTTYRGVANSANHLAKLDLATGAIDTAFSPPGTTSNGFDTSNPNGTVYAVAVAGTSLYVGGEFTAYRGVANSACALAKLDLETGDIDTTFSPPGGANNGFGIWSPYIAVLALTVSGTSLYVGGWDLSTYRGVANAANSLAKLDLVSGDIDTSFSPPGATNNGFGVSDSVRALAAAGSHLVVGGNLSVYRGTRSLGNFALLDLASGDLP